MLRVTTRSKEALMEKWKIHQGQRLHQSDHHDYRFPNFSHPIGAISFGLNINSAIIVGPLLISSLLISLIKWSFSSKNDCAQLRIYVSCSESKVRVKRDFKA